MSDWAIPQQAKLKYTQLFNLHDRSRSGFLSGLQCRDILLQSGLPRNTLAEIWNLSDIDGDGQLTREEFILAMHLTNNCRLGQTLPTELPSDLVPPSYRRTRSISTTSVHSTASVGSSVGGNNDDQSSQKSSEIANALSGSVLNSHSFEDKRRENFEKGRAELERRRLKILEQQAAILREQLASGKKQVAEAKSKIDSMRTERDTKAGLITSLEAQLQALRDRKVYLDHEEDRLMVVAKDLNLINPAQAELDQLAIQSKQQNIVLMKEKLIELSKQKEVKAQDLEAAGRRVNDLKVELKELTETVSKRYETYGDKVANAKIMREQFIQENKSQPTNLESVWDSAPCPGPTKSETQAPFPAPSQVDDPWSSKAASDHQATPFDASTPWDNNNQVFSNDSTFLDPNPACVLDSKTPEPKVGAKRYRVLYAFEARNLDELTINPGDVVVGSDQVCEPGWLLGELDGRSGLFPEAYVELFAEEPKDLWDSNVPASEEVSSPTITSQALEPIQDKCNAAVSGHRYKVLYAFDARNPDELTINPGDIIIGLESAHEPGWLMGESGGKRGLFPEAYVEQVAEAKHEHQEPGKSRAKKSEVATVIANYRALGQEQLNLDKGQLVLIRRKMDSGWWEGEIQVKGKKKQFGWFPSSYVKLLSNSSGNSGAASNPS